MTVRQIVQDDLKENGYDGLHSHPEDNRYAGCGCGIRDIFCCGEQNMDCEPAYSHKPNECERCNDREICEPFSEGEKFMFCGKKNAKNA
jgi:hypothetical protein